jgi:glycosyltransferase involved in cell wall biosynthesis
VRSILVTEAHPWPLTGGIALRNGANAAALARLGPLAIVGVGDRCEERPVSPLGESTAIGLGHPPVADPTDSWRWRPDGHPSDARWDELTERRWREVVRRFRPDVVVIEQLWLHHAIEAAQRAGVPTVLDAHNVEAAVYAAIAAGASDDPAAGDMALRTATLEAATVARVDQVWACSAGDRDTLAALAPGLDARVVPNAVDTDALPRRDVAMRAPMLLLTASFAYPPNVDAARVVLDDVLPRFVAAVGPATVSLVGRDPPAWMRQVGRRRADVEVTGAVPSTLPWLQRATAMVLALGAGSGTRFKVLEALAVGLPVVSTPKGVEGLDVQPGRDVLVGVTPEELAMLAARVHHGEFAELADRGRALVTRRYSWSTVAAAIAEALVAVGGDCR